LENQAVFLGAEIIQMDREDTAEWPPWFEAIPLYDVIPNLFNIRQKGSRKRKAPQVKADFLITYVDDNGPCPPSLVDVKSRKPSVDEKLKWQIISAMRLGFIFQFAYPKIGVELPISLNEWELRTPCSKCNRLSNDFRNCSECGCEIFSFTIVDDHFGLKAIMKEISSKYK
jgi:hypothetical protein